MYADVCMAAAVIATSEFQLFIRRDYWVAQLQFSMRLVGGVWAERGRQGTLG